MPPGWDLRRRVRLSWGEIAYDALGYGPPVILVHGTPGNSYAWREVASRLADRFTVYVFDLLGFGDSERRKGVNFSIAAQARLLAELVRSWGLKNPAIAGHDIGGAISLRAHLLEGVPFSRIALIDAVALRPWITSTTRHVKANMEAYETMPTAIFEAIVASHLRTTTHGPMAEDAFAAYMRQWSGAIGQELYLQKDARLDEEDTAAFEPLLGSIEVPVQIVWGEHDAWLPPTIAERLHETIPNSAVLILPETGHFAMEDSPDEVARALEEFFAAGAPVTGLSH